MSEITPASVASFINAFIGFTSILLILRNEVLIGSVLLIVAAVIDFLDGKIARYFGDSSDFGKNIDSLADIISFGVAPAFLMSNFLTGYLYPIPFLLVLGGIYRLARYNIDDYRNTFMGMPITFNGLIVPLVYLAGGLTNIYINIILSIVLLILMVARFELKKYV